MTTEAKSTLRIEAFKIKQNGDMFERTIKITNRSTEIEFLEQSHNRDDLEIIDHENFRIDARVERLASHNGDLRSELEGTTRDAETFREALLNIKKTVDSMEGGI